MAVSVAVAAVLPESNLPTKPLAPVVAVADRLAPSAASLPPLAVTVAVTAVETPSDASFPPLVGVDAVTARLAPRENATDPSAVRVAVAEVLTVPENATLPAALTVAVAAVFALNELVTRPPELRVAVAAVSAPSEIELIAGSIATQTWARFEPPPEVPLVKVIELELLVLFSACENRVLNRRSDTLGAPSRSSAELVAPLNVSAGIDDAESPITLTAAPKAAAVTASVALAVLLEVVVLGSADCFTPKKLAVPTEYLPVPVKVPETEMV